VRRWLINKREQKRRLTMSPAGPERRFAAMPQYVRNQRQTGLVTKGVEKSKMTKADLSAEM